MKGDKFKLILIYLLILVVLGLVGSLIYIFLNNKDTKKEVNTSNKEENEITEKCVFDITMNDYSNIISGKTANICGGLNEFNITDIALNNVALDVRIIYNNGKIKNSDKDTGIYINDKLATKYAATNYLNNFGIFDNKLFIYSRGEDNLNVMAYNSLGDKVYDLSQALTKANITDQVLATLAKTNPGLKIIVNPNNIDPNNVQFGANEFSFSTNSGLDCSQGMYSGSTYKVTFTGDTFSTPQFVSYNNCVNQPQQ